MVFFASNGVAPMIFLFLFCRQWWVPSSDLFIFIPNGGSLQVTFFSPSMGGHFK
jgi:hypothetical protein